MMKFVQIMTHGVGEKTVTFTGREPFRVTDEDFANSLIANGCFERLADGTIRYIGKVSVPLKDGAEALVDEKGYLNVDAKDLAGPLGGAFI